MTVRNYVSIQVFRLCAYCTSHSRGPTVSCCSRNTLLWQRVHSKKLCIQDHGQWHV